MSFFTRALSVAAIAIAVAAPVAAQNYQFELINQSGFTVTQLYTSPTTDSDWGPDILGANVLPSGMSTFVTIGDGRTECVYDMRMVFEDGSALDDVVDICAIGTYTIN